MTPERRAEIYANIAWWCQQEDWRIHGFGIACTDPLFPTHKRRTIMNKEDGKVLHCMIYAFIFFEHHKDFEFTKRIKYEKLHGDFDAMYLEVTWDVEERLWYSFWKKTTRNVTMWVHSDKFEYKHPHVSNYESEIVVCN